MKHFFSALMLAAVCAVFTGCSKDDDSDNGGGNGAQAWVKIGDKTVNLPYAYIDQPSEEEGYTVVYFYNKDIMPAITGKVTTLSDVKAIAFAYDKKNNKFYDCDYEEWDKMSVFDEPVGYTIYEFIDIDEIIWKRDGKAWTFEATDIEAEVWEYDPKTDNEIITGTAKASFLCSGTPTDITAFVGDEEDYGANYIVVKDPAMKARLRTLTRSNTK